jgi:hypothetical protein
MVLCSVLTDTENTNGVAAPEGTTTPWMSAARSSPGSYALTLLCLAARTAMRPNPTLLSTSAIT